ncbi:hypothetical protein [Streptomyces sp. NPDC005485]|uniref:hypothetical protein n=1 Tax=Streptomyces sp. NPDC005485 TaxID=3155591 RepID=UPI0033B28B74
MSASPAVRSLRAAVFAVLCVLLAAGGHALASGQAPPLWVDAAGFLPVFAAGVLLGGRERSLMGIGCGMLAAQAGLHLAFEAAESRMRTPMVMHGASMAQAHMSHGHTVRAHMAHPHALVAHATAGHVAAALLATWWLRRGEAALWSLLRRAAVLVPGLAAWWRVRTAPPQPLVPGGACRGVVALRPFQQVLLRHAVSRRGPPAGIPYTP